MSLFSGEPTIWDQEPPKDPVAESKSKDIDAWLQQERMKELSTSYRILVLSPSDGEESDAFRERVADFLGESYEVNSQCVASVKTDKRQKKESKLKMSGLEPSLLIYCIDPGEQDKVKDSHKVLTKMKKALSNFLYTTRSLGVGKGCCVLLLFSRGFNLSNFCQGPEREAWVDLFPYLKQGLDPRIAIEQEFEAAAKAAGQPLAVTSQFDDAHFSDLSGLKELINRCHRTLMNSVLNHYTDKNGSPATMNDPIFHDAIQSHEDKSVVQAGNESTLPSPGDANALRRKQTLILFASRVIFAIEAFLVLGAFIFGMPWEQISNLIVFVFERLGLPLPF